MFQGLGALQFLYVQYVGTLTHPCISVHVLARGTFDKPGFDGNKNIFLHCSTENGKNPIVELNLQLLSIFPPSHFLHS